MLRNLLLMFASIATGFVLLEAAARFAVVLPGPYALPVEMVVKDVRGFWTLNPGFVGKMDNRVDFSDKRISVSGDGSRMIPCRNRSDGPRVVLIGDSQTFGHGLSDEESWANRLQCALKDAGTAWRVFNLGVPGVNIDSYVARLVQIVPVLSPNDRVIVFVTWNDLHSFQRRDGVSRAASSTNALAPVTPGAPISAIPVQPVAYLGEYTWRYRLYGKTGIFVPRFDDVKTFVESMLFSSVLFNIAYPRIRELNFMFRSTDALFAKIPDGTFENNFRLLGNMGDAVRRTGAAFDVVLLPNRVFFDQTYYGAYSQGGKIFPD
jgi:hypothetical protein